MKIACQNCGLSAFCLPLGLEHKDLQALEGIIRCSRPLHRGDHLFRRGDPFHALYAVKTGSIKTYQQSGREEQVLGFYLPGELLGLEAVQESSHLCSAQVLETTVVCEVPFARLESLTQAIPDLQHQLYRIFSKTIGQDKDMLMLLGKKSAEERLASFLLSISERLQRRGLCATDFHLSMSRTEIANYLGLAVETVSRLFTRFQDEGLLRVDRRHVQIVALERLRSGGPTDEHPDRMACAGG